MKEYLKKYGVVLILIFGVGLVISYGWFISPVGFTTGEICKSSWLSFWGSYLSFFGTVFLGLVAIWQNQKAKEINDRLLKLQSFEYIPVVVLDGHVAEFEIFDSPIIEMFNGYQYTNANSKLSFTIRNLSEVPVINISISQIELGCAEQDVLDFDKLGYSSGCDKNCLYKDETAKCFVLIPSKLTHYENVKDQISFIMNLDLEMNTIYHQKFTQKMTVKIHAQKQQYGFKSSIYASSLKMQEDTLNGQA